jgi:hypothetical protein
VSVDEILTKQIIGISKQVIGFNKMPKIADLRHIADKLSFHSRQLSLGKKAAAMGGIAAA